MSRDTHWNSVYTKKAPQRLSWHAPTLSCSLTLIDKATLPVPPAIIDVGGGASTLHGHLLDRGVDPLTVLDIAQSAIDVARQQLGERGAQVRWLVGDITQATLPASAFDLWHDRAVFHFLTSPADRAAYVAQVLHALKPDGWLMVATFSLDGPERCSGLPVARYDEHTLAVQFGADFERVAYQHDVHLTPSGTAQAFVYCLLRRVPAPSSR